MTGGTVTAATRLPCRPSSIHKHQKKQQKDKKHPESLVADNANKIQLESGRCFHKLCRC